MKPHWKLPGNLDDFNKANENIIPTLNKSTQILEVEGAMSEAKRTMARSRLGGGENKAFNFLINNKKKLDNKFKSLSELIKTKEFKMDF